MRDQDRNDLSALISRTASEQGRFVPLSLRCAIADAILAEGFARPAVVYRHPEPSLEEVPLALAQRLAAFARAHNGRIPVRWPR